MQVGTSNCTIARGYSSRDNKQNYLSRNKTYFTISRNLRSWLNTLQISFENQWNPLIIWTCQRFLCQYDSFKKCWLWKKNQIYFISLSTISVLLLACNIYLGVGGKGTLKHPIFAPISHYYVQFAWYCLFILYSSFIRLRCV